MDEILKVCSELTFGGRLQVDFLGKGNIWIENTYEPEVLRLAQYILYQALDQTAAGQLTIWGYDSDLSGVFAPFAKLSAEEPRTLELLGSQKDFADRLEYIRQKIQEVQNMIQGLEDSLLEFRSREKKSIESYRLVALSLDMDRLDQSLRAKLSQLMRAGPRFGFSFLIISTTEISAETAGGGEIEIPVSSIASRSTTVLEADEGEVSRKEQVYQREERNYRWVRTGSGRYQSLEPKEIIEKCRSLQTGKKPAGTSIGFGGLHGETMWTRKSVDGLTFTIGKYGVDPMEITIGDEKNQRHNAVITGAVGQGKSNLISVIIHSLCWRYPPEELQLYLLDFKEGVTFKAFSNIGQEAYLPHARALGLESDASFGIAVLEFLYQEYQRRMKLLKERGVKSLQELRKQGPDVVLPRIVAIIDEFQMMFGEDAQTGQRAAELLEKSVRLFRAAGIHFILASQTLSGNVALAQRRESIFGQIPIRIALKNSVSESQQTLGIHNPAAAFLKPREAIVNLDYGEVSQNQTTMIAFADEEFLKPRREQWWEMARRSCPAPYVFESGRRITVSGGMEKLEELRRGRGTPAALVGDRISVDGTHVLLPLSDDPGRNIAVIGMPDKEVNQAAGILQSIAVSLAVQDTKGDARFLFCDFEGQGEPYEERWPKFAELMETMGHFLEDVQPRDFEETLKELLTQESGTVYVFGSGMDRWRCTPEFPGQDSVLKTLAEEGPSKGIHFIGWWVKASSFTAQTSGFGGGDAFNSKIFLRIEERAVQSLTNPFVRWNAQDNRALVSDAVELAEELTFIPCSPVTQEDAERFRGQIWD